VVEFPKIIVESHLRILLFRLLSPMGTVAVPVSHICEVNSPVYDLWERLEYKMAIGAKPMPWAMCSDKLLYRE